MRRRASLARPVRDRRARAAIRRRRSRWRRSGRRRRRRDGSARCCGKRGSTRSSAGTRSSRTRRCASPKEQLREGFAMIDRALTRLAAKACSAHRHATVARRHGGPLLLLFHRHRPEVDRLAGDFDRLLRRIVVAHREGLRHDARARLQLLVQLRNQLLVQRLQQVERDDRRLADVGRRRDPRSGS